MIPTEKETWKKSKRTPRWLFLIYIVIALGVIAAIIFQLFIVFEDSWRIQRVEAGYHKYIYCNSLCPTETQYNDYGQLQRFFDASCKNSCEKEYVDSMNENDRQTLKEIFNGERNSSFRMLNNSYNYFNCEGNMKSNLSFLYINCMQNLFAIVTKETDLSEVRLPKFTSYYFEISEFSCSTNVARVRRDRGQGENISLIFTVNDVNGKEIKTATSNVPALGESSEYPLSIKGLGKVSKLGLVAVDSITNRSVTNPIWKKCQ
ncbi:hypothetical protein FJZ18_02385 [Candidatus Pacearchaeota archaeon]|nr:hypothetical protein [Candidatus Pacearchaeota archaeon]